MARSNPWDYRYAIAKTQAKKVSGLKPTPEILLARENFDFFCEFMNPKWKPEEFHKKWTPYWDTNESNGVLKKIAGPNDVVLSPRGSAKSTRLGLFAAYAIGHNPDIQIIYTSYSESVSLSRSILIKRLVASLRYQMIFPWIAPGSRWADTVWEIDKERAGIDDIESDYTFFAAGITGSITSRRSSLILYDDLIKNSASIASPETREKIVNNIAEAIQPTLIPGGREMAVGTLFRPDDVYATTLTEENGYRVHRQSAIIIDMYGKERSYWPSRFKLEGEKGLLELRRKNPVIFEYQYQNRIAPVSGIAISNAWMPRKELICPINEFDILVIGGDLASKEKEQNDDTVFILGGRKGRHFQLIDYRAGKWGGNISKILEIFELCLDWDILTIDPTQKPSDFKSYADFRKGRSYISTGVTVKLCMEDTAYQASLAGDFKDYVTHEKEVYSFVYRGMPSRSDKVSRLQGVTGVMENGLVSFNKYVNFDYVINQLRNFGSWDSDDAVDAFEKTMRGLLSYGNVMLGD